MAFGQLTQADLALTPTELEKHRDYFWFDLCAEWDSKYLHKELLRSGVALSREFRSFEQAWFEDEINHAKGFIALYSLLYDEPEADIIAKLNQRRPDFSGLEQFLDSEFKLALLFAYDELATMRAYHLDLELYDSLGHECFSQFLRGLIRDETFHHQNAFEVLRVLHAHRFPDMADSIAAILNRDLTTREYHATFIFDHEWEHIDDDFFRDTAAMLAAKTERLIAKTAS